MRNGTYSKRKVSCVAAFRSGAMSPGSPGGYIAEPGNIISYRTEMQDGSYCREIGRMFARVSAPAEGEGQYACPRINGWIAVIQLSDSGCNGYVRWVDPSTVTGIRKNPKAFMAFLFADELPSTEDILTMDRQGMLGNDAIERHGAGPMTFPK